MSALGAIAGRVEVFLAKNGERAGPVYETAAGEIYVKIDKAPESGSYTVETRVYGVGGGLLGSFSSPLEILDQPKDLWTPACRIVDGKAVIVFASPIAAAPAGYGVTVNGAAVGFEQSGDCTLVLDLTGVKPGDKIAVTGVVFPLLYPSYSFKFTILAT